MGAEEGFFPVEFVSGSLDGENGVRNLAGVDVTVRVSPR